MEAVKTPIIDVPPAGSGGSDPKDVEANKDLAAFSYLWIMSVVVYFARRNSPFIRFHAKQAMVLFALSIVFAFIPLLSKPLEIVALVGMVYGFLNAAQGLWKDVPIVGPLSRGEISLRGAWKQVTSFVVKIFHRAKKATASGSTQNPPQPPVPPVPPLAS